MLRMCGQSCQTPALKSYELIFKKKKNNNQTNQQKKEMVLLCFGKFTNIRLCLSTLACPLSAMNVG